MNHRAKFDDDSLNLSSPEKSVTVQTNKNKQTVTDISTPCLSECVDKKKESVMSTSYSPSACHRQAGRAAIRAHRGRSSIYTAVDCLHFSKSAQTGSAPHVC